MKTSLLLFLLLLLAPFAKSLALRLPVCDEGHWQNTSSSEESFGDAGLLAGQDASLMCPADTFMHSCFFHGTLARASSLLRRKWVSSDTACVEYSPVAFLAALRNRKLYLLGDSTTMQVFQSLVCSLFSATSTKLQLDWYQHQSKNYGKRVCPFGAKHCHLTAGTIHFPEYGSAIIFRQFFSYSSRGILKELLVDATNKDVCILNWGLHTNDQATFEGHLKLFAEDLESLVHPPTLFFQESVPTHFSVAANQSGYFSADASFEQKQICAPFAHQNWSHYRAFDWRNNLLGHLNSSRIQVLRISKALYTQHDAHLDGDSKTIHFQAADCLHYCAQSGIYTFLKRVVQNHVASVVVDPSPTFSSFREGALFRSADSRAVYIMQGGQLHEYLSLASFQKTGRDFSEVHVLPTPLFDLMSRGTPIDDR